MIEISEKLKERLEETLKKMDCKIYFIDQEIFGQDLHLIIYIQHLDITKVVTLDECVLVSQEVNGYIDNYIDEKYILEISSPGINRQLYTKRHFIEVIDEKVEVRLKSKVEKIDGKKFQGYLLAYDDTKLNIDGIEIPVSKIKKVMYIGRTND